MQILKEDRIIFYDVDDTLVFWPGQPQYNSEDIMSLASLYPILGGDKFLKLTPNHKVIEDLKEKKKEGYYIIVWSQASFSWAEQVVQGLKLNTYVDIVMSKPVHIVDDLKPEEIFVWRHPSEVKNEKEER